MQKVCLVKQSFIYSLTGPFPKVCSNFNISIWCETRPNVFEYRGRWDMFDFGYLCHWRYHVLIRLVEWQSMKLDENHAEPEMRWFLWVMPGLMWSVRSVAFLLQDKVFYSRTQGLCRKASPNRLFLSVAEAYCRRICVRRAMKMARLT